jgi:hypothetical protein
VLVDVTLFAEPIGTGIIGSDGTFSIPVSELIANHRIGIMAGFVMGDPPESPEAYVAALSRFRGEGNVDLPNVGFILASSLVGEQQ